MLWIPEGVRVNGVVCGKTVICIDRMTMIDPSFFWYLANNFKRQGFSENIQEAKKASLRALVEEYGEKEHRFGMV